MSMTEIMHSMGDKGFGEYMNSPDDGCDGVADVKTFQNGKYVVCPYCGKKNLKVLPETKIHMLPMKCKGSSCKKEFLVNVE